MSDASVVRVVRGDPSAEELAAVAALLAAAGGSDSPAAPAKQLARGRWNDPAHLMRRPVRSGPGGWLAAR